MSVVSELTSAARPNGMVAKHNSKCLSRCGLQIHAGHDEIERGYYGWQHVNCEQARTRAWIRERFAAGDACADIQFKLMHPDSGATPAEKMAGCVYALDYANEVGE